ncbi:MAG: hypothetical protein QXK56_06290 [Sulfolobales archaeon]
MVALSRNTLVIGVTLLSIAFIPFPPELLNILRINSFFLGLIFFTLGAMLSGYSLNDKKLIKYPMLIILQIIMVLFSLTLIILEHKAPHNIYVFNKVIIVTTLVSFLTLYIYIWRLFKKKFKSINKAIYDAVSMIIAISLAISTYLMPKIITIFTGVCTYEFSEDQLRYYYMLSVIMFPSLLILSLIYSSLPDF